ncbi:hypothetical protein [Epilithonimonas hispanica]|uniref:Uncharacterized protein n=1 Tax=Epilithonimonas hispanica TaxID=358687 RepID=A0A3D9D0B0_9FLAO|nr:hypothetical protein [Epilithonimonas hispanica]REC71351.1 hypothetical protein DRF58_05920 [Epilithonimonas hispanica]
MNDLELLIMIKKAFKKHLNAPKNQQPSLLQLLSLIKLIREIIIEDYKLKQQINDDIRTTKNATLDEI